MSLDRLIPERAARALRWALVAPALALGGCQGTAILNPAGDVALQERNLILYSTGLMLLIILPVMAATAVFAWRYRETNTTATYDPEFDHSTMLELLIWSAPLMIIICLGALTWSSTHLLDPYRPVSRITKGQLVPQGQKPLEIQAVAMDWKWLFIYPEQGVAAVNQLVLPVNRPVHFDISSVSQMNTLSIPSLSGAIYAMPGMQTQLSVVMNKPGVQTGFSGHYSGAGFSDMNFHVYGVNDGQFSSWIDGLRRSPVQLNRANFIKLEQPSEDVPPMKLAAAEPGLFNRVVNRCIEPGKPCESDVMAADMRAGGGNPHNVRPGAAEPAVNDDQPMHGEKPKGAIFQGPGDIQVAPHRNEPAAEGGMKPNMGKPKGPSQPIPGNTKPGDIKNRDMSMLTDARARALA